MMSLNQTVAAAQLRRTPRIDPNTTCSNGRRHTLLLTV